LHFEVVYGISNNSRTWFDNSNAWRMGYRPQDSSDGYAEEILRGSPPPGSTPADVFQGGGHCMAEGGTRSSLASETASSSPPKSTRKRAAKALARKLPVRRMTAR